MLVHVKVGVAILEHQRAPCGRKQARLLGGGRHPVDPSQLPSVDTVSWIPALQH